MALDPEKKRELDEAAKRARDEFERGWENWSITELAEWWNRWCQVGRTNHDRLGKILVDVTGVRQRGRIVERREID